MSFLKSVLFGSEGSYNIFRIQAKFEKEDPLSIPSSELQGAGFISNAAMKCRISDVFRLVAQGYTHVFIHEMSHAVTFKLLTNKKAKVRIFKSSCTGRTEFPFPIGNLGNWKTTIICAAGPMGDVAFSTCKLVAASALKSYLSWPIALALWSGGVIGISGELIDAYTAVLNNNTGDFGHIARVGKTHLALATTALVCQAALGIFAAIKLAA